MSEIFKKIPLVMAEIGAIGKTRNNPQQGYKFRGIDEVYNAVNAALAKHEVFCVPTVLEMTREERQTKQGGTLLYTILKIKYLFYASDGSNFECITMGEAMDSGDKSCNKAMSAAQKYAFFQVFSIPTEEHKDTELESHQVAGKKSSVQVAEKQGVPASSPEPPAPSISKPVDKDFAFLQAMGKEKARVGEETYYAMLGEYGYEKSTEIHDSDQRKQVYKALLALHDKEKK